MNGLLLLPYEFGPEPGMAAGGSDDESDTKEESESSDDEVDHVFEAKNACRLETLIWCRHWMRALHVKAKSHRIVLVSR